MSVRSLDALVLGGGPAALLTAALLGKRGLRGWVVDQRELDDVEPAHPSDWALDDRHAPLLARVHETLGLQDALRRTAVPLRPGLRLLAPGGRGELEPEDDPAKTLARLLGLAPEAVKRELRALDAAGAKTSAFLEGLEVFPPSGFFERRRAQAALQRHPELGSPAEEAISAPLLELLQSLLPFVSFIEGGPPTLGRLARPAELLLRGPRLPDGGRPLREVLAERAARGGFEVLRGAVTTLEPEGRRFRVEATDRRDAALVGVVVDATRDLSGLDALPHRFRGRKLAAPLEAARPVGGLLRAGWTVAEGALPEALGRAALVLPEPSDPWPMWLTVGAPEADGRSPLWAEAPIHAAALRSGAEGPARSLGSRLERLFPFFEAEPAASTSVRPCFAPDLDPSTGLGGAPVRTGLKNVLLAGPIVLPGGLAVEGAYLAARQAADAASELLGAPTRA